MNRINHLTANRKLSAVRSPIRSLIGVLAMTAVSPLAFADVGALPPAQTQRIAQQASNPAAATEVEPILGYTPDANGISFQVTSGGCTQLTDFRVQAEMAGDNLVKLVLLRMQPDTCHSFVPTGQRIYLSYSEMGISPSVQFSLANPNGVVKPAVWGQN